MGKATPTCTSTRVEERLMADHAAACRRVVQPEVDDSLPPTPEMKLIRPGRQSRRLHESRLKQLQQRVAAGEDLARTAAAQLLPSPVRAAIAEAFKAAGNESKKAKKARKMEPGQRGVQGEAFAKPSVPSVQYDGFAAPAGLEVTGTELLAESEQAAQAAINQLLSIIASAPDPILVPAEETGIGIAVLFTRAAARVPCETLGALLKTQIYNKTFEGIDLKKRTTSTYPSPLLGVAFGEPR